MNNLQKIISRLFKMILPLIDRLAYLQFFNQPFSAYPILNYQTYKELAEGAKKNTYSIEGVDKLEKQSGFMIDRDWLNSLAFQTQISIKKSKLNYAHGRVLYAVLRTYLTTLKQDNKKINVIETGTARGFSALCMAKALNDSGFEGSIFTVDALPHHKKIFWNCAADHLKGKQTRQDLLSDWNEFIERYIIFVQGYTRHLFPKLGLSRIHFAFLDGAHTYEDVLFEFNIISNRQKKSDIIVFDDYNEKNFPGVVKAVNYIAKEMSYNVEIIHNKETLRDYVIAKKIN